MPRLRFKNVTKSFGDNEVIKGVDAEVPDQEFLVLLGPSGCGKSTMLRMIAGLADVTGGEIWFDDTKVNGLEPRQRNVAFVFQSYALYPHLTVRGNIAFPLIMDRFKWYHHAPVLNGVMKRLFARSPEVRAQVERVAEMLELTPYLDRRPKTLSGGQRQRVAVARALVREPSVYLLDEPLSNLDAKLRTQMRAEITALYQRVRKTFVYVTHDQVEAMTMGTRVIVLNEGEVQQYGTPKEIYARPANTFVARFIGSPAMNLIPARVENGSVHIQDGGELPLDVAAERPADAAGDVTLGVRAEKIVVVPRGKTQAPHLRGHVTVVEHLGAESIVGVRLGAPETGLLGEAAARDVIFARMPGEVDLEARQDCDIVLDLGQPSWFDPQTGRRLAKTAAAEAGVAS